MTLVMILSSISLLLFELFTDVLDKCFVEVMLQIMLMKYAGL